MERSYNGWNMERSYNGWNIERKKKRRKEGRGS
jgi:hypothetical protein